MDMAIAAIGAVALLIVSTYCLRFIYNYRIRNGFIEVVLFGALPILRIAIQDIQSIKLASWRDLGIGFFTLRFGNRLTINNMVLIERQGLPHRVVITPINPHDFVANVLRLQKHSAA